MISPEQLNELYESRIELVAMLEWAFLVLGPGKRDYVSDDKEKVDAFFEKTHAAELRFGAAFRGPVREALLAANLDWDTEVAIGDRPFATGHDALHAIAMQIVLWLQLYDGAYRDEMVFPPDYFSDGRFKIQLDDEGARLRDKYGGSPANRKADTTDNKTDTKTDNEKKFSEPPDDVRMAGNFIVKKIKLARQARLKDPKRITILREYTKHNEKKAKGFDRQFYADRYGEWLRNQIDAIPDKQKK